MDGGASLNAAVLDSAAVSMAQQNGWKGIIVNGAIRNADSMKSSQIGVKALGTHPSRGQQTMGQRSMPLTIGGINLSPGQWVYADKVRPHYYYDVFCFLIFCSYFVVLLRTKLVEHKYLTPSKSYFLPLL